MKKTPIIMLGIAVALGVVALIATSGGGAGGEKTLHIAGYATPEQLAADNARGLLEGPLPIAHPIDEISITRDGTTMRLVREGAGEDTSWRLTEPVDAPAVKYQVEKICQLFKTDVASAFATAVKADDLAVYDLEPERRIALTVKSNGALYGGAAELIIGKVDKGESAQPGKEPGHDTWVARPGELGVVYRITGKDLRTPVDVDLDAIRAKKLLSAKPEDFKKIVIKQPSGSSVTLEATRTETPAKEEGKPPVVKADWRLTAPAGVPGDTSISAVARSLSNVQVKAFTPLNDELKDVIGAKPWVITAEKVDGETVEIQIADGDGDEIWGRVTGKDELFKVASYAANNLRKAIWDLRDKKVVDIDKDTIDGIVLGGEGETLEVDKAGDAWRFVRPARPFPADPAPILSSVARVQAARFAKPSELPDAREALAHAEIIGSVRAAGKTTAVTFSGLIEEGPDKGKRWGAIGDAATADPFLIQDYSAKRWVSSADALRLKKLFAHRDKATLKRIDVTLANGERYSLERPADGGDLALVDVPEGKKPKAGPIRTIGATALALAAKRFVSGKTTAEMGLGPKDGTRLALTFADGTRRTVTISDKADEGDNFATVDGGPLGAAHFVINAYQAKNLSKPLAELYE